MPTAQPLAYSYVRFSHPDQANGDSFRRQTDLRNAWIARNHVTLDTSLTLEDKGVSGYTGEHRDNPDRHALAAFVSLVKKGRIARGSYLVVESLDRLSREDILPALSLVLDLIQSGIRIVQLLPAEMIYDQNANPMQVMMMIMELSRGHSESVMKSERGGAAWREKKRRAVEDGEPLTARVPAWLRLVEGRWEVDEDAATVIRRIYRMAADGFGTIAITKTLNAERVPNFGGGGHWPRSYVCKILANRAVIGEYQPYKGRGKKRGQDGKANPHFYPAIITEREFYAARSCLAARRGKHGRLPEGRVNLFSGLLRDARGGGTFHEVDKGKRGGRRLVSYKGIQGIAGQSITSFPAETFERAILSCLREIKPAEILPREAGGADEAIALTGRLAEVESQIEHLKARLQARYSDAIADVLERHEADSKALLAKLMEARLKASAPLSEAWGECRSLLELLDSAPDPEAARIRLKAAIRRIVEGIWCVFVGRDSHRLAVVQIWFAGGSHRDYLILHRPALGGAVGSRPAQWWVRCPEHVLKTKDFDLRCRESVESIVKILTETDIDLIISAMQRTGR
jgi:DNA invertase Pin-like site-specific DNA recombinase